MPRKNTMPVTDFDNLLREKFEQGSFEYQPASWERLSAQLPVKKKPLYKKLLWLPLAAAAAIAGFIIVPHIRENKTIQSAPTRSTSTAQQSARPTPVLSTTPVATTKSQAATQPGSTAVPTVVIISSSRPSPSTTLASIPVDRAMVPPVADPAADLNPAASGPDAGGRTLPQIVPQSADNQLSKSAVAGNKMSGLPATQYIVDGVRLPRKGPVFSHGDPIFDNEVPRTIPASSISVAGGYKYGTANMGYMVGINGRKSLGDKIFVEGDIAFANSRNAQVTTETSNETFDLVKTVAGTNTIGARAISRGEVVGNMYYLQLTPTVGYQVLRTMSLGAGADMQRMFRNEDNTLYVMDGTDVKAVPQMDYGVVGKAEYSLTKTFKAGIQYRQGMNTLLAPEKNYLNRSYIQVQLKLGILGR